jgi:glucose-1-phosphate thymidylyltransferase
VPTDDIRRLIGHWQHHPELDGLLALLPVTREEVAATAVVMTDGPWVRQIVEKPDPAEAPSTTASISLYCFGPRLWEHLAGVTPSARGEYELQDAVQGLIDDGGTVQGVAVSGRMTLTRPADLLAIARNQLTETPPERPIPAQLGPGSRLIPPVYLAPEVIIGMGCTVGPTVAVERGVRIGDGATIEDAVLMPGVVVPAGAKVRGQVLV